MKSYSDKIDETLRKIKAPNTEIREQANERLDSLTKPRGSLGRLEELAANIVSMRSELRPELKKRMVFVFAGDHGVTAEGVSAYPGEVTPQMVMNFINGGAGINVLSRQAGAEVTVVDVGVAYDFPDLNGLINKKVVHGTRNMVIEPALTMDEAIACIEAGLDVAGEFAKKGYNLFGTGEMGIGNTTPASCIAALYSGLPVADVTGRGTGINDEALGKKVAVIEKALELHSPDTENVLDVLSRIGGAEIGGIAGLCIGAASLSIPVLVDGFISSAGALLACQIEPTVKKYLIASHRSVERGHQALLDLMELKPLFDLDLRLGEGTGAALGMILVESALRIYNDMATFAEAAVSGEKKSNQPVQS